MADRERRGWAEADRAAGPEAILSFDTDGDSHRVMVLSEPEVVDSSFRGQTRERIRFVVYSAGKICYLYIGKVTYKKVRPFREELEEKALIVTRAGAKGDTNTSYSVEAKKATKAEVQALADWRADDIPF